MATTYRPDEDTAARLERLQQQTGLSVQKLLDRAIQEMDERTGEQRAERVQQAFRNAEERWAPVLERLRTA